MARRLALPARSLRQWHEQAVFAIAGRCIGFRCRPIFWARPAVWRWQARYAEQCVDGLLRGKTRKPGRAPLSARVVAKVMGLTCSKPPGHATHWTGRALATAVGVSLRAVQRLWEAHRLQPHRLRTFKCSSVEKVENIVGLYMDPPKQAVVVSIDMRRAKSRRSTARDRACRSSPENARR
jgi:hypothetical protein